MNGEHKSAQCDRTEDRVTQDAKALADRLEGVAQRELAQVLAILRESYSPSDPMETMLICAFKIGAGWAFNLDAELGDVASLKDIANG